MLALGPQNGPNIYPKIAKIEVRKFTNFWIVFFLIVDPVLGPFGDPFWGQNGSRSAKMGPRRTSRASNTEKLHLQKLCFFQLKNHIFRVLGALKTSIRRSRRLSRGTPKKGFQTLTRFGTDLGAKMDPKMNQKNIKRDQKWNHMHVSIYKNLIILTAIGIFLSENHYFRGTANFSRWVLGPKMDPNRSHNC